MNFQAQERKVRELFERELASLSKDVPVMLFPVRIETHFRHKSNKKQLCVRIFPDEVMFDYHTEKLSPSEVEAGRFFWLQWYIASGNEEREYEAWEVLCRKYSVSRAAWICRCLKPKGINDFKKGGRLFYRRPYGEIDSVFENCNKIYEDISQIVLSEKKKITETGEYKLEYDMRTHIKTLRMLLFQVSTDLSSCELVVDYIYDRVVETVRYLKRKLESVFDFYQQYPGMYGHNSRKLELWDIDYTLLVGFIKDVKSFLDEFESKRVSLEDLVKMYLIDSKYEIFTKQDVREEDHIDLPVTNTLPDRFYFIGEIDNENKEDLVYAYGNPVKKDLQVAFDLNKKDLNEEVKITEQGDLKVDGGLSWMFDYEQAEKSGMAITVPIDEDVCAFRYIYVLGVNQSSYENPSILENLFIGHNYSSTGLELLRAGHPSNIIEGGPRAVSLDEEEIKRRRYEVEVNDAYKLLTEGKKDYKKYDTYKLSEFLGMDYDNCWGRVVQYDENVSDQTKQVFSFLWDEYVLTLPKEIREKSEVCQMLNYVGGFASSYIRPFGTLPTLCVDSLPYGIQPVTNYVKLREELEKYAKTDEERRLKGLLEQLILLCVKWKEIRKRRVKNIDAIKSYENPEASYLEMVGQTPHSVSFVERSYLHSPFIPLNRPKLSGAQYINQMSDLDYFGAQGIDDVYVEGSIEDLVKKLEEQYKLEREQAVLQVSSFFDTFTYRLDAWFTAILYKIYSGREKLPCVGAYGWVFNLRENTRTEILSTDRIVEQMQLQHEIGKSKIYRNTGDDMGHYVVAPSIQHAITAAVLRSAYLKNSKRDNDTHICVNLSSMRVRQALKLVDGIKSGMSLAVVLGVDFERYMHDDAEDLDQYIYSFRKMFPLTIDLEAANEDFRANDYTMQVVNGEALLNTFLNQWNYDGSVSDWLLKRYGEKNSGIEWVDVLENEMVNIEHVKAIFRIVERMADAYDALNDLLLSEGVHRLVMGDKPTYYVLNKFLSEGKGTLPEPEVLKSPMEKVVVSYKAGVLLPEKSTVDKPLSIASPAIDSLVLEYIGSMDSILFVIRTTDAENTQEDVRCSLGELSVSASEYLYLSSYPDTFRNYLATRWRIANGYTRQDLSVIFNLSETTVLKSELETDIYEDALRISKIRELVLNGRAMRPSDWLNGIYEDKVEESLIDVAELSERYNLLVANINYTYDAITNWQKMTNQNVAITDDQMFQAYSLLCECVEAGLVNSQVDFVAGAFLGNLDPVSDYTAYNRVIGEQLKIREEMESARLLLLDRLREAKELIESDHEKLTSEKLVSAIKTITLKNLRVECRFFLREEYQEEKFYDIISRGVNLYNNLDDNKFDDWQEEISEVRPGMRNWHQLSILQTVYDCPIGSVSLIQSDSDGNMLTDEWMGVEVDSESKLTDADTLVLYNSNWYKARKDGERMSYAGIVFDSWVEYIPYKKHTAGIAVHCDRPDNEAPQAILYAIHPEIITPNKGSWNSKALLDMIGYTRLLAMNRAVEPDHLYSEGETHLIFPLIGRTLISYGVNNGRKSSQSSNRIDEEEFSSIFDSMCGGDLLNDI
ncbi:MAG: hypothetical protein K6G31_04005 [Paludibacteraceae bacterium]|nr:hypothetical protein [Paludibacteraceae bacterium]